MPREAPAAVVHSHHGSGEDDALPLHDGLGLAPELPVDAALEAEGSLEVRAQDAVLQLGRIREKVDQLFAAVRVGHRCHGFAMRLVLEPPDEKRQPPSVRLEPMRCLVL